jgi:serine/threonine protein phosphatase PrpC
MYISACFIDVKKSQDYADFSDDPDYRVLVLCDGIGEFQDSRTISEFAVNQFITNRYNNLRELILDGELEKMKKSGLHAGTTFIKAIQLKNTNKICIEFLGDGGIIHLPGDFDILPHSDFPYKYNEIMLPHNSPNGQLNRHISHRSTKAELAPGEIELKLNHPSGDILLFFTDGISSLEEKVILRDDHGRYWRSESEAIQFILQNLSEFLQNTNSNGFQDSLVQFNHSILQKLKNNNLLEDDASLGIIVTPNVLKNLNFQSND